jgi:hypothetical protein
MSDFSLRKWYMDAADDRGDVYIGYSVSLKWGKLELNGVQHLWRSPGEGVKTQTKITRNCPPEYKNRDKLVWKTGTVEGTWESVEKPIVAILLDTKDGKIEWQCNQPKARATIKTAQLSFSGWGYTECINITIPVWKLPFKVLYWGRCHTKSHSLVWIKWEGKTRRDLIWFDGKCSQEFIIEADKITGPDFRLQLGENVPLREGKLGSTIFPSLGNLTRILPEMVLSVDERKWYNRGTLETAAGEESATVIYEEVRW